MGLDIVNDIRNRKREKRLPKRHGEFLKATEKTFQGRYPTPKNQEITATIQQLEMRLSGVAGSLSLV